MWGKNADSVMYRISQEHSSFIKRVTFMYVKTNSDLFLDYDERDKMKENDLVDEVLMDRNQ